MRGDITSVGATKGMDVLIIDENVEDEVIGVFVSDREGILKSRIPGENAVAKGDVQLSKASSSLLAKADTGLREVFLRSGSLMLIRSPLKGTAPPAPLAKLLLLPKLIFGWFMAFLID